MTAVLDTRGAVLTCRACGATTEPDAATVREYNTTDQAGQLEQRFAILCGDCRRQPVHTIHARLCEQRNA